MKKKRKRIKVKIKLTKNPKGFTIERKKVEKQ